MGCLCRAPVPPGASWDAGGGGSRWRGSSAPGDALNPLPAAVGHSGGRGSGAGKAGGPQLEVAAGLSSPTPRLPARPAVFPGEPRRTTALGWVPAPPGKGSEPQGAGGTPQQSPAGAGSWAAGTFAEPEAPPAVPISLASCLRPRSGSGEPDVSSPSLPPRFLGGKLRLRSVSQGRGRVSMEMGAGVRAPSCWRPPNKGESGTLMGARPPGRASQPRPKITPPGERCAGSRPGPSPAAGRGSARSGSSQERPPSPACRRPPAPAPLRWGRGGPARRIETRTEGEGEPQPASGRRTPRAPLPAAGRGTWGGRVRGASLSPS